MEHKNSTSLKGSHTALLSDHTSNASRKMAEEKNLQHQVGTATTGNLFKQPEEDQSKSKSNNQTSPMSH